MTVELYFSNHLLLATFVSFNRSLVFNDASRTQTIYVNFPRNYVTFFARKNQASRFQIFLSLVFLVAEYFMRITTTSMMLNSSLCVII